MWNKRARPVRASGLVGVAGRLALVMAAVYLSLGAFVEPPPQPEVGLPAGDADAGPCECGKARAMAQRFLAESAEGEVPAYSEESRRAAREAMDASDALHYELDIEVSNLNPAGNTCTLTGTNRMTIRSSIDGMIEFTFRLRSQYTITSALLNDTTDITGSVTTLSTTTRHAPLDRAYNTGDEFTLTIAYTGNTFSAGFGSINVGTHSGTPIVETLSEPYYSYSWWPVKDGDVGVPGDNSDKATIDFAITVPNNYVVPSNGLLVSEQALSGDRKRYEWSTAYPITAYLVSFAATNYNTWSVDYTHPGGTMPVQFFIYPTNDTPTNRASWEKAVDMIEAFVPFYGEYPFIDEKYGIYNFNFGGGMEHQTITGQTGFGESLTSHELSHQWWGDMITCKTWSDIWLNEGFATFSECLWEEYKTGTQNLAAYFSAILSRKPFSIGGTVYVYPDEISVGRIFDSNLSYRKGAWVLHQLRGVVGDTTFFDILSDYRAAYAFSAATTDEFAAVASSTYGQDLSWFFDQWVYQAGWPTYQFGWANVNVEGQDYLHVRIAQTQSAAYPPVFIMPVDLVVTIGGSPQTVTVWNDQRTQIFVVPVAGPVTALQFDPNQWILRSSAQNVGYTPGSLDGDGDVDGDDFSLFELCFTDVGGQLADGCEPGDFDGDGDIDCTDWNQFTLAWTDPGDPPFFDGCASVRTPLAAPFPHDRPKNRYLSFDPNKQQNDGVDVAFRVELESLTLGSCSGNGAPCRSDQGDDDCRACSTAGDPCLSAAIDCSPPTQSCDLTGESCVNDLAGSVGRSWWVGPASPLGNDVHLLVSEPFRKVSADWPAVVHVGDCEVVPQATYAIRAVNTGTGDTSGKLLVSTIDRPGPRYWADGVGSLAEYCTGSLAPCGGEGDPPCAAGEACIQQWPPPDGVTNFDDVTAALFAFQQAPGLTLPATMWVDLHGNGSGGEGGESFDPPNAVVNFSDMSFMVLAFQGRPYPFHDPADCPDTAAWPP